MKLRTFAAAALAAGAFGLAAAPALADTWSAAYSGTIVATYSDGHSVNVYVEPDHTYTIVPASGDTISGTWSDDGSQSCFTITAPAEDAGGSPVCIPDKDYQVGDSFQGDDATGHFTGVINSGR